MPISLSQLKMALYQDMSDVLATMKNTLSSEVKSLEKGAESVMQEIASITRKDFLPFLDELYKKIKDAGDKAAGDVEYVLSASKSAAESLVTEGEKMFHTFVKKTDKALQDMKAVGSKTISDISTASSYIRTQARKDFRELVKGAEEAIEDAKNKFKDAITDLAKGVYDKIKEGVDALIGDAKTELKDLEGFKNHVIGAVEEGAEHIKNSIIAFKDASVKEMEIIVEMVKTRLEEMEARIKSAKQGVEDFQRSVALTVFFLCAGSSLALVLWKTARHEMAIEDAKKKS